MREEEEEEKKDGAILKNLRVRSYWFKKPADRAELPLKTQKYKSCFAKKTQAGSYMWVTAKL